jgi:lipoyl(octanoyl) transferase
MMRASGAPRLRWDWLGRAAYAAVQQRQLELRDGILAGRAAPALLLCEHPPVMTLGRSAQAANLLADAAELAAAGITIHRIERGGDVTYHGPGQLMIYPVIPIRSVLAFLETVGQTLAQVCARFGVAGAEFRREPAGLWIAASKIAACGVHLRRGVVVHGWAFNVATPAQAWRRLRPCGGAAPQLSLAEARTQLGLPELSLAAVVAEVGPRLAAALPTVMPTASSQRSP